MRPLLQRRRSRTRLGQLVAPVTATSMPVSSPANWTRVYSEDFDTYYPIGAFVSDPSAGQNDDRILASSPAYTRYGPKIEIYPDNNWDTDHYARYWASKTMYTRAAAGANGALCIRLHTEVLGGVSTPLSAWFRPRYGTTDAKKFGRYTMRMRSAPLPGYGAVMQLIATDGTWPDSGEDDFPEGAVAGNIEGFDHYAAPQGTNPNQIYVKPMPLRYWADWHTYTQEWMPGRHIWYIDGVVVHDSTDRVSDWPREFIFQSGGHGVVPPASADGDIEIDWITIDEYTPGSTPPTVGPGPSAVSGTPNPANLWKAPQGSDSQLAAHPEIAPITAQPTSKWLTGSETQAYVAGLATQAGGKTMVLNVYAIPGRDGSGYSGGGFPTRASYVDWVGQMVDGIGTAPAMVILEADGLGLAAGYTDARKAEQVETIRQAVSKFVGKANIELYVDVSMWASVATMAQMLKDVGVANVAGFAINTSNFQSTASCFTYGDQLITALNGLGVTGQKYVFDTARNGNGPLTSAFPGGQSWLDAGEEWCNPPGRRTGINPGPGDTANHPAHRAYLWIKVPGESDGLRPTLAQSNYFGESAPAAGTFWLPYARDMVGLSPT